MSTDVSAPMSLRGDDARPRASHAPPAAPALDEGVGLPWLVRLRWGAVAGQALALVIAALLLSLELPWGTLIGLTVFTALTNALLAWLSRGSQREWMTPAVLVIDILVLTAMLTVAGGASNPFTVFFLVHVALAALLLKPKLAWCVLALTIVAFASLFIPRAPTGHEHHDHAHGHGGAWSMHLVGMWIAYALAASFVAHFVSRVSRAIRDRDRRLAEVKELALQNERLATLSAFSANAAHELGTPLGTIGLAAKELALGLRSGASAESLANDADLVSREVARCRAILSELSSRAGESMGEMPVATTAGALVDGVRGVLSHRQADITVEFAAGAETAPVVAPPRTVAQMVANLVRNAFDAHEEAGVDAPVVLRVTLDDGVCFHVRDRGAGVPAALLERLGEPFTTTKSDKGGLGLGVYLAHAYAQRTRGRLWFDSRPGGGTDVAFRLPRDVVQGT